MLEFELLALDGSFVHDRQNKAPVRIVLQLGYTRQTISPRTFDITHHSESRTSQL